MVTVSGLGCATCLPAVGEVHRVFTCAPPTWASQVFGLSWRICYVDASGAPPRELAHAHISSEPLHHKFEIKLLSPSRRKEAQEKEFDSVPCPLSRTEYAQTTHVPLAVCSISHPLTGVSELLPQSVRTIKAQPWPVAGFPQQMTHLWSIALVSPWILFIILTENIFSLLPEREEERQDPCKREA